MCLTTLNPEIKTATEDIIVYKGGDRRTRSFRFISVHIAFYYYLGIKTKEVKLNHAEWKDRYQVELGYHSFAFEAQARVYFKYGVFVIPKGAEYIQGEDNGDETIAVYVSSNLIYLGAPGSLTSKIIMKWRKIFKKG